MPKPTRDASPYDIYLEHSASGVSERVGYMLAPDESGGLGIRAATAPLLAQQLQLGGFGYDQVPADIYVPIPFDSFEGGAGYAEDAGQGKNRYNYSRGVDLSGHDRAYLSPLVQEHTVVAAAPAKFLDSTDGFFVIAGSAIFEHDGVNTTAWTSRHSLAGAGTDVIEKDGTIFVACGDAATYAYSTDGVTFTNSTLADPYAHRFAVRGQSSGTAVLFKITSTGALKTNSSGINGGAAWSAATQLGHTSEGMGAFLEADDSLFAFKKEGIYSFNGTITEDVWTGGKQLRRAQNGLSALRYINGKMYTTYGDKILEIDPLSLDMRWVFPTDEMVGNSEINGQITAFADDGTWIYFALKNSAGNSYVMKLRPGEEPIVHTYIYLGANDCNAMIVVGPGVMVTSNPCLVIGYGTKVAHFVLPRSGLRPEDDANMLFDTGVSCNVYGSWMDAAATAFRKFLNSGQVLARNVGSGTKAITLMYETDDSGSQTTLVSATGVGTTSTNVSSTVEFNRIRYVTNLLGTLSSSPVLLAQSFNVTLNPPRRRTWTFDIMVGDRLPLRGGGVSRFSGRQLEDHLFDSLTQRVTFYDRRGRSHTVRVLDIQANTAHPRNEGDVEVYTVSCAQVIEPFVLSAGVYG